MDVLVTRYPETVDVTILSRSTYEYMISDKEKENGTVSLSRGEHMLPYRKWQTQGVSNTIDKIWLKSYITGGFPRSNRYLTATENPVQSRENEREVENSDGQTPMAQWQVEKAPGKKGWVRLKSSSGFYLKANGTGEKLSITNRSDLEEVLWLPERIPSPNN